MNDKEQILKAFEMMLATTNLSQDIRLAADIMIMDTLFNTVEDMNLLVKFKDWLIDSSVHNEEDLIKILE